MKEVITIDRDRYDDLVESENLLNALRGCGVDNWEGYSDALALLEEEKEN